MDLCHAAGGTDRHHVRQGTHVDQMGAHGHKMWGSNVRLPCPWKACNGLVYGGPFGGVDGDGKGKVEGGGIPYGRVTERSFALESWLRILGVSELSEVESTTPAICCLLRPPESSHPSTPLAFEPASHKLLRLGSFEILSILWRVEELHTVGWGLFVWCTRLQSLG